MNANNLPAGWVQTDERNRDFRADPETRAHIHHYESGIGYCWQVHRGSVSNCNLTDTLDEAHAFCDRHLAMPMDDFRRVAADKLLADINRLNGELSALGYCDQIEGYNAGYQQGRADEKAAILALLNPILHTEGEPA